MTVEQIIDYIVSHKNNLNGNILIEMLEAFYNADEPALPSGLEPNPGGGTWAV